MKTPMTLILLALLAACGEPANNTSGDAGSNGEASTVKDGVEKTYYDDGSLQTEVPYKNGRKHGIGHTYYQGTKDYMYEVVYKNNVKHGDSKAFYEDGTLNRVLPYNNGKKHGVEKKYHPNGNLAAEKPWHNNHMGIGLKEYNRDGKLLKKNIPEITISEQNSTAIDGKFVLLISTKDGTKAVDFYEGELTDDKFMNDGLTELSTSGGVARYEVAVPKGGFKMKKLNFVAKVKTYYKNYHIIQKSYNLAVDN